jgi:hypothetical protein
MKKMVLTVTCITNRREHHKDNNWDGGLERSTCCLEQNISTPRMVIQILGHIINLQCIQQQTFKFSGSKISGTHAQAVY